MAISWPNPYPIGQGNTIIDTAGTRLARVGVLLVLLVLLVLAVFGPF